MREYLVWCESGDLISGPHRKREVAERNAEKARRRCANAKDFRQGCGNGNPVTGEHPDGIACGIFEPHGISVKATEDGYYVSDY